MHKYPLMRTKFGADIVAEFLPSTKRTNKVAIITSGAPGYPGGKNDLMRLLSERGYFALLPRYRGTWESTGEFLAAPPSDDVLLMIDELPVGFRDAWSSAEYKIHEPEVYLIGGSFGGPAALLASRDARVRKAAVISSVIDWREQEHTVEPLPLMSTFVSQAFGGAYRGDPEAWHKLARGGFYNPIDEQTTIEGNKLLVIHAKDDNAVPYAPAERFAQEVGAQFVGLTRGGHMGAGAAAEPHIWKHIQKFFTSP